MGNRREVLTPFRSYDANVNHEHNWVVPAVEPQSERRPWSPIQALMETAPHDEPETSQLELLALRDILADALDDLSPRDRRLIEARVIERRSFRSLERELGWKKSHMQRRERFLLKELAVSLSSHPAIAGYLNRHQPDEAERVDE